MISLTEQLAKAADAKPYDSDKAQRNPCAKQD